MSEDVLKSEVERWKFRAFQALDMVGESQRQTLYMGIVCLALGFIIAYTIYH